jgi:hypothetical protein
MNSWRAGPTNFASTTSSETSARPTSLSEERGGKRAIS